MKLQAREDLRLGREVVFAAITDVDIIERQLLRRGIDVQRTDAGRDVQPGACWSATLDWGGRKLPLTVHVADVIKPEAIVIQARSGGLTGDLRIELAALSRKDTRMRVTLTVTARGLRDRLFLKSMVLARPQLSQRFSRLVSTFAQMIAARSEAI